MRGDEAPLCLSDMAVTDLDAVLAVEHLAYAVPWTRGNFIDSLAAGHSAVLLTGARREPIGYFVAMDGVDELHLLNLTVHPDHQGRGHARFLLDELVRLARHKRACEIWLEVRDSNQRAKALYLRYGFSAVGLRRGYYPLPPGVAGREDAAVMSFKLPQGDAHGLE